MKNYFLPVLISLLLCLSCNKDKSEKVVSDTVHYADEELSFAFSTFEEDVNSKIITPTYRIRVESDTVSFEGFMITFSALDEPLKIFINNDTISVQDMFTQNCVESEKIQADYSNMISDIQYYKDYDFILFKALFYPCTGLGCGVNYQVIYHTKSKKSFVFGRFRTGFDMELYYYNDEKTYYLSKSYNGRNIQGIDTIRYELFRVDFSLQELKPLDDIFAETVYDENDNRRIISFTKQWIDE
ncbi:hypothetical protein [Avrilella dinanensis]|uniref:Uncharacterized protein n=1 Tax=Avrilella dinanensis TaxID=2008672 RepID=A0A2M9R3U1_9FLAO|nr:hypothetical protein [Avrilella dinanensis]PJR03531.1 hypothetical protein CDL10_02625 [Avrilella dinanensis]